MSERVTREELMKQIAVRRDGISKLLNVHFFCRFTVEIARKEVVRNDGTQGLETVFAVKIYGREKLLKTELVVGLGDSNSTIVSNVRRELVRCGLD